jgi:two-component system response regulator GlrR
VREALDRATPPLTPLDEARRAFEREYLARILKITQGNVTQAARLAGRNRTEFYRLLDRHALQPGMFKLSSTHDNENVEASTASRART